jgi:hypothetical protein
MRTKILLTVTIVFFIAFTSQGQINKGDIFLGGNLNFGTSNNTLSPVNSNSISNNFGTSIQVGKVIKDNTIAGVQLSYFNNNGHNKISPDSNYNKENGYGLGVFYRQYQKLAKNFYWFGELDGSYYYTSSHQTSTENSITDSKSTRQSINLSFVPGLSYAISKKAFMELLMTNLLTIAYSHIKYEDTYYQGTTPVSSSTTQNGFNFNANLNSNILSNFAIGFKLMLGK